MLMSNSNTNSNLNITLYYNYKYKAEDELSYLALLYGNKREKVIVEWPNKTYEPNNRCTVCGCH